MAASKIDQKILGRICKETAPEHPLLSSALYQILGLSIRLSQKLFRARKLRRLNSVGETRSLTLYHHIIWLSREGLSITELFVLPHCQDGAQGAHCRVMAAKLRASFFHVFCLFHNHPPIIHSSPKRTSPKSVSTVDQHVRARRAALRDTIHSITSETSYVTNPYASEGPAQSPPPSYPVPPVPTLAAQGRRTPVRPPGLVPGNTPSPQVSPASNADFLLPPLDFVPATSRYFSTATDLAQRLLPGADPLRLSVALEHCAFASDCGKDLDTARDLARLTIHDVYTATEAMEDGDFDDAAMLVQAIAMMAKTIEGSPHQSQATGEIKRQGTPIRSQGASPSVTNTTARHLARRRASSGTQPRQNLKISTSQQLPSPETQTGSGRPEDESTNSNVSPSVDAGVAQQGYSSRESVRRSRANSTTKQVSTTAGQIETDKERKRRILEKAEEEVREKSSVRTPGSSLDNKTASAAASGK